MDHLEFLFLNGSKYEDLVRPERLELSWTRSTRPSTVPVYQFQHGRNMPHNKSMTSRFQIDKFHYGI